MNNLYDWKEQGKKVIAAKNATTLSDMYKLAAMTAVNDADIEKAFADQASGFVENAVGPLMQDQYRIGFEIVKANKDNTRLCGIFAFKINKDLIFAPVFFINGTIKGPLLYRCDRKMFVPANKDWANYLIENIEMSDGHGVPSSDRGKNPPLVQIQRAMMVPPGVVKGAAAVPVKRKRRKRNGKAIDAADKAAIENEMISEGLHKKLVKDDYNREFTNRFNKKYKDKYTSEVEEEDQAEKIATRIVKEVNVPSCTCRMQCCEDTCKECDPLETDIGEFKVKNYNEKYNVPGKLNTGDYVLKVAAWDDGTIRIGDYPITQNDGRAIANEKPLTIEVPGVAAFDIPASGAALLKQAFLQNVPDNTDTWLPALMEGIDTLSKPSGLLPELLKDEEYGYASADLITKAAASKDGYGFAEMLNSMYGSPSTWEVSAPMQKKASQEKPDDLILAVSPKPLQEGAGIPERYWKDGFYILDKRPEETMSVVYQTSPDLLSFPTDLGTYSVMLADGSFLEDVLIGRPSDIPSDQSHYTGWLQDMGWKTLGGKGEYNHPSGHYVIIKDGKSRYSHGCLAVRTGSLADYKGSVKSPEKGHLYFIAVKGMNSLLGPIAVDDVTTRDGVKFISAWGVKDLRSPNTLHNSAIWDGECPEVETNKNTLGDITLNPDMEHSDIMEGSYGKDALFIPLDRDSSKRLTAFGNDWCESAEILNEQIGNTRDIRQWLFNRYHVSIGSIRKEERMADKKAFYFFGEANSSSKPMDKKAAMVHLTRDLGVSAKQSYELLDKADESTNPVEFVLQRNGIHKNASQYTVIDSPQFQDEFSSEFGIPIQPDQTFALRVVGNQIHEQPSAVGDRLDPTSPTGLPDLTVATADPEELRSLADSYHLPNVFEHGVVGTLAETFNAMKLVEKYLPDMERALDKICRIKFLMYWCPNDFERTYGDDDMTNLEAEIESNETAFGALYLKLLKQNEKSKKADAKLMGDEIIE